MTGDQSDFYRRLGDTPWSGDELAAAFQRAAELHETPHDDWDRRPHGVKLEKPDGTLESLTFNPDMIQNQIGLWLAARFREQGLDFQTRQCHMWRFFETLTFIQDHEEQLRQSGLMRQSQEDPDAAEISEALFHVLATAKYDGVRLQRGDPLPAFHRDRVIEQAKTMESEEGTT